jgi:hypothetical protein
VLENKNIELEAEQAHGNWVGAGQGLGRGCESFFLEDLKYSHLFITFS